MRDESAKTKAEAPPEVPVCVQEGCLLRDKDVDAEFLADLLVDVFAGNDVGERLREKRIARRAPCVECVRGVLEGREPIPTEAHWRKLVDAAHWTQRRERRQRFHERLEENG